MNFKKQIAAITAVLLIAGSAPVQPFAENFGSDAVRVNAAETETSGECGDNVTWEYKEFQDKNILYINGSGPMYDYYSALDVPYYHLTEKIDKIYVSSDVTYLGQNTMCTVRRGCEFVIPETVRNFGKNVFDSSGNFYKSLEKKLDDKVSLYILNGYLLGHKYNINYNINETPYPVIESIEIPRDLDIHTIGVGAFVDNLKINKLVIPSTVTEIKAEAFKGCQIKDLTLSRNLKYIGNEAFYGGYITAEYSPGVLDIPDGVTFIGENAFCSCTIGEVYIPDSVTFLGSSAFRFVNGLTKVRLSASLENIYDNTFEGFQQIGFVDKLSYIVIPESVKYISDTAFKNRNALKYYFVIGENEDVWPYLYNRNLEYIQIKDENDPGKIVENNPDKIINLPEGITEINQGNIFNCPNVKVVRFPESVPSSLIRGNRYTFVNTPNLKAIAAYDADKEYYYNLLSIPLSHDSKVLTFDNVSGEKEFYKGTTFIVPEGIESINDYAFFGCEKLETVVIPESVKSISDYAFAKCDSLRTIIGPSGSCAEQLARESQRLTFVSNDDIWDHSNQALRWSIRSKGQASVETFQAGEMPESSNPNKSIFSKNNGEDYSSLVLSAEIDKKYTSVSAYAFSECENMTEVNIPETVKNIGAFAFNGCKSLKNISLPLKLEAIGESAFSGCENLSSVTIPENIKNIEASTFNDCKSLENISLPLKLETIGESAFSGCESVNSVMIPETVNNIEASAFSGCKSLESIALPSKLETINKSVFSGCEAMTSVVIPETVKNIEASAFNGCKSLEGIEIPAEIESIGEFAFSGCEAMTSATIPETIKNIESGLFAGCKSLEKITFSQEVTSIGSDAFKDCKSMDKFIFHYGLESIGEGAFSGSGIAAVVMNDKIKSVEKNTFNSAFNLRAALLSDELTEIGESAFENCTLLTFTKIPEKVTSIGARAYYNCPNIWTATVPQSVREIGEYALGYVPDENGNPVAVKDFTIRGYKYSAAEKYAKKNGFEFISLGEADIIVDKVLFPDEALLAYIAEYADIDGNGILSDEEICAVKTLDLYSAEVKPESLEGIELFTELEELKVNASNCKEADFSSNKKLEVLDLAGTYVVSSGSLASLNISECENLRELNISGHQKITELDLSKNVNLEKLEFRGCLIENADFSANPNLRELDFSLGIVSELNISECSKLEKLLCAGNRLEKLDLSANPELFYLECGQNFISELKITDTKLLTGINDSKFSISGQETDNIKIYMTPLQASNYEPEENEEIIIDAGIATDEKLTIDQYLTKFTAALKNAAAMASDENITVTKMVFTDSAPERKDVIFPINSSKTVYCMLDTDSETKTGTVVVSSYFKDHKIILPPDIEGLFSAINNSALFPKMTEIDLSGLDFSKVTNMKDMFKGSSLQTIKFGDADTSNVTDMSSMFQNCSSIKSIDLKSFCTSNVRNFEYMFAGCFGYLTELDVSGFDTSKATSMKGMFKNCRRLRSIDLRSFNTSNVTTMEEMFRECYALETLNLSSFDFRNTETLYNFLYQCQALKDVVLPVSTSTSNCKKFGSMFANCISLENIKNISTLKTENSTDLANMFSKCGSLKSLDLSGFTVYADANIYGMFDGAAALTEIDLTGFSIYPDRTNAVFNNTKALEKIYCSETLYNRLAEIGEIDPDKVKRAEKSTSSSVTASFKSVSATLSEGITLNFYVESDVENAEKLNDAYIHFTSENTDKKISFSDASVSADGQKNVYKFCVPVRPDMMTELITACIVNADGSTGKSVTVSVENYLRLIDRSAESSQNIVDLSNAIKRFGAYSQKYTGNTEDMIEKTESYTEDAVIGDEYAAAKIGVSDNISVSSASLRVGAYTSIRVCFTVSEKFNADNLTIAVTDSSGNMLPFDTEQSGNKVYVNLRNIKPQDLDEMFTFTANDGTAEVSLTYSAFSYMKAAFANGSSSQELKDLLNAMYEYNQAAEALVTASENN